MKIGIYLINIHHTVLDDLVKIFEPGINEIHLFISNKLLSSLKVLNPKIEQQAVLHIYTGDSLNRYNKIVSKFSENLDYMIVSPNSGRQGIISHLFLKPRCKYLFIDVIFGDAYLNYFNFFVFGILWNSIYRILYKLQMKRANGLIYSSRSVMNELKPFINKKMLFIPFNFYDNNRLIPKLQKEDYFTFTATGTMEKRRKDFSQLFEALKILINDKEADISNMRIVMLGGLLNDNNEFGLDMISKSKELNKLAKFDLIKIFEEKFIGESTYRHYISQTNVILNPLNMENYKYGKFCSGMSECISYSLPGLYPESYEFLEELNTSSVKYSNANDLYLIFKKVISDCEYYKYLLNEAKKNSKHFSIENIRDEIYQFLKLL
ncbi:MAG: hypothetical protein A2033_15405 [Bacteroidetes bacterium GWA2_31_9]|nr:MAG: hypothetical protein A2033_15405 [Bacteroidetes bacterium GWA2_31_9]